jgi:transposase
LKSTREQLDIITAYQELGSYRAAAKLCGTTDKTVKQIVERQQLAQLAYRTPPRPAHNTDSVRDLIHQRVAATDGRITAKRLLPRARAAGYTGSARNFRRAVAAIKAQWRQRRRVYRPWVPSPGEHLVIDWGQEGKLQIFCAVLAWSRYRFVRFAADQRRETTLRMLADCFSELGGTVANVVVPHPEYVRFAAHYGFRFDFCEAADPESKGVVENLVGYAKSDLVVPAEGWASPEAGNRDALPWCVEVNERMHSVIQAVPVIRLIAEKELLRPLPSLRPRLRAGELRKVERAVTYRRFRPGDVRAILEAGVGVSSPTAPGEALLLDLPAVPTRPLSARALEQLS